MLIAIAAMVQETAIQRLERALESKTRVAGEQLALEPGDLMDFWRKPATKDESGWHRPAQVGEARGQGVEQAAATTIKHQETQRAGQYNC